MVYSLLIAYVFPTCMLYFSYSIKVFYGSGDCLVLSIPTPDSDDIPEIVRRLEEISIGCQVKQVSITGFLLSKCVVHVYAHDQLAVCFG